MVIIVKCSFLHSTQRKRFLSDCSADWNIAGRSWWDERGKQWVCLSSPLFAHFFSPHQLCMNISSGGIGLQQQESVEMQLHHLTRPLSSFHPSHTLFMLLLNLAGCQFTGLLFHQVAFFHYLPDGSPTLFLHPCHFFFHFLLTSLFAPLSPLLPPYARLTVSLLLCLYYISHLVPLSPLGAQEV